jgi:transposase
VLARRTFRQRAWELGAALDWAAACAATAGFAGVTVAAEPTGHRWRVVGQLAAERGMALVRVQPLMSAWARRAEDLTFDKTDDKDAVLIARLAAQLRCYLPEPADETWSRSGWSVHGDRRGLPSHAGNRTATAHGRAGQRATEGLTYLLGQPPG